MSSDRSGLPLIIAHRGASGAIPENTCLALATAIEQGADMVEVDVQLSRDGCPVIFHDWTLGRLARSAHHTRSALRSLGVCDLTVDEVRRLDVGSWKSRQFGGLTIPTLSELLLQCGGRIALNLELKVPDDARTRSRTAELVDQVGEALARYSGPGAILISSFDRAALERARAAFPTGRLGVLPQPGGIAETLRLADRLGAISVHLRCTDVRPALVKTIHAGGRKAYAYTADRVSTMRRLIGAGADGIFTNYPDRMAKLLRSHSWTRTHV